MTLAADDLIDLLSETIPTDRDRVISEACRNSGSRAERDAIIASYRVELQSSLSELEASIESSVACVERGRFEVQRLLGVGERLRRIGECTTQDDARELAVDEFNRAEAAEARVRDLEAVALRLSTYSETLESANADLAGSLERAEAAEAKLARVRERVEQNFVHTRDSLRELMEEP